MKYNIVCVLRVGTWTHPGKPDKKATYGPEHVLWLKRQIDKHYNGKIGFVCLSDCEIPGVDTIPLKHDWPGWWSKIELFRPDLGLDRMFYMDLDTIITGNIMPMVKKEYRFAALLNLTRNKGISSAMMSWRAKTGFKLYETFKKDPQKYMDYYVKSNKWGDQGFTEDHIGRVDYIQKDFPNQIVSYTMDMKKQGDPPPGTKIVIFHGPPKPWEVKASWIPSL